MTTGATIPLTFGQVAYCRQRAGEAKREARAAIREARLWRLMTPERAAARYVDNHANARGSLRHAAAARRTAVYYATLAAAGRAPEWSSWDPRSWGLPPAGEGVNR